METGLESIAYNLNRRNSDLQFFEFGKTYSQKETGKYEEQNHLAVYITGKTSADSWKSKGDKADFYYTKGICEKIMELTGLQITEYLHEANDKLDNAVTVKVKNKTVAVLGNLNKQMLSKFDIKQPVMFADINWDAVMELNKKLVIEYSEIPKFPSVQRDLAVVVDKSIRYEQIEKATYGAKVNKLKSINLFDIFESEKLGNNKKSMAVSFVFSDEEKTMTDKEIDAMMSKIIASCEKELNAEIRK